MTEQHAGWRSQLESVDPRRVAHLECAAWVAYYQRRWLRLLAAIVGLMHAGPRMSWPRTLCAGWFALRAIQRWAPFPANDPERARRYMRQFYAMIRASYGDPRDPDEAARLEVEWWHVHRVAQNTAPGDYHELVEALTRLYALVFAVAESDVRAAAVYRCRAMQISDQWVTQGRRARSPLLGQQRAALVRSYAALLAAVHC